MADQKHIEIEGEKLLDRIRVQAMFKNKFPKAIFRTGTLKETGDSVDETLKQKHKSRYYEWDNYKSGVVVKQDKVYVNSLASENMRFRTYLKELEEAYLQRYLLPRDKALQEIVLLGQEVLRRKYFALLLNPSREIVLSSAAELLVETGSFAIQVLGRSPAGPKHPYRKFNNSQMPAVPSLGIEILSSGSFPDWTDRSLKKLRAEGKITKMGFENVIDAALDTPRGLALKKLLEEGADFSPLAFPLYQRMMLDLELMRLGQATTPGTFKMLLNSFYYGALFVDHSTNVSEQVQIIYEEENWKSPCPVKDDGEAEKQAEDAAKKLLGEFFRMKQDSIINRNHPREARIEFTANIAPGYLKKFFTGLMHNLKKGVVIKNKGLVKIAPGQKVTPALNLEDPETNKETVKKMIDLFAPIGIKEFYVTSEIIHPKPGLLQYFKSAEDANEIIKYSKAKRVAILDGRTIDVVATANKAIEAAAGAIESGQGCIKIGLLNLTLEEMKEFIRRVKKGLEASYKRQQNQLLVFIGIIDRPIVSKDFVYEKPLDVAEKFIELMHSLRHDILLIDTMDKGATNKRLVDDGDKKKGGHFTHNQIKMLNKKAQDGKCDLWVAGSYTEQQVYEAAMDSPKERPSLICLGGAERSFGGLRLDPNEAYSPISQSEEEKKLSAMLEYDADVKYMLSRDNKLARDAGNVVGELKRRGSPKWKRLDKMRKDYLEVRKDYFTFIADIAEKKKIRVKNIDTLTLKGDEVFKNLSKTELREIGIRKRKFDDYRMKYVNTVADEMILLFKEEWIKEA